MRNSLRQRGLGLCSFRDEVVISAAKGGELVGFALIEEGEDGKSSEVANDPNG